LLKRLRVRLQSIGLKIKMELTTAQQIEQELPPAEPHFDEEATLLSARRVVPLEKIEAERRSKKSLVFAAVILFSLIVGGLGGALIFKQGQKQSTAILDSAVPGAAGIATKESVATPAVAESLADAGTGTLPDNGALPAESKSAPARLPRIDSPRVGTREKSLPGELDDQELRGAERIEERRLRRRYEREAQKEARRQRDRSDDVLRIREIFEGSRRP
jgi:hypothetical protein